MSEDTKIGLESSLRNLRKLSHRELGDFIEALAMLCETFNASQVPLRGATDERPVIQSTDDKYLRAVRLSRLALPLDEREGRLMQRAGCHTSTVMAVIAAYSPGNPAKPITLAGLPGYGG